MPGCDNLSMLIDALTVLSAAASLVVSPTKGVERVTPQTALQRVWGCGLGPATIRYEHELQSHILSMPSATAATESQLRCLDMATGFGIDVELPATLQPRFDTVRGARASAFIKTEARDWLSKRGLLDRVPRYVPGVTDEATFTRAVEHLCGPLAKGAFKSKYGPHVLSPEWVQEYGLLPGTGLPPKDGDMDVLTCLMKVTTVAGFEVGLIGNEVYGR